MKHIKTVKAETVHIIEITEFELKLILETLVNTHSAWGHDLYDDLRKLENK